MSEIDDVVQGLAEQARLSEMREQTEKLVRGLCPDVVVVLSLPTYCLYSDVNDSDAEWTAIAVVNIEKVEDERNLTAEGDTQGEALLNLAALVRKIPV